MCDRRGRVVDDVQLILLAHFPSTKHGRAGLKISSRRIKLAVPVALWDENIERGESVTFREVVEA